MIFKKFVRAPRGRQGCVCDPLNMLKKKNLLRILRYITAYKSNYLGQNIISEDRG